MRICRTCGDVKELNSFRNHSGCKEGKSYQCKLCFKEWTKAYEKTEDGFLMRAYRNMLSRINGIQKSKYHLYKDKYILSKQEFYDWSNASNFKDLFSLYTSSGYQMKLAPSVDRIDSSVGYELSNIRWITHSENSRLGSLSKNNKLKGEKNDT
jgi:hypothetical protein